MDCYLWKENRFHSDMFKSRFLQLGFEHLLPLNPRRLGYLKAINYTMLHSEHQGYSNILTLFGL